MQNIGGKSIANSRLVRVVNEGIVLSVMRKYKELSRSDVEKLTSLTYPTVSKAISNLLEEGLLIESGQGESRGGRPPRLVRFNPDSGLFVGVQIDKSWIRFGGFSLDYRLMEKCTLPLPNVSPVIVRDCVVQGVSEIVTMSDPSRRLYGVGIGFPGMIHPETNAVVSRSPFRWLEPVHFVEETMEQLQVPVCIDNDINVAALGEMFSASRKNLDSWVYISVGTGVGSGIILNGQILRGVSGGAGELGHLSIDHNGVVCSCGARGCLENYVSTIAIGEKLGLANDSIDCFRILHARLQAGDPQAIRVYSETVECLVTAILSVLNLLNPFAVILGGEITELGDRFLEDLRKGISRGCDNAQFACNQLILSRLGADAGLYGGAVLADQYVFGTPPLCLDVI